MLNELTSDSPLASYEEEFEDSISDCIWQAVSQYSGLLPTSLYELQKLVVSILERAIEEAVGDDLSVEQIVEQFCLERGTRHSDAYRRLISDMVSSERPVYFADVIAYAIGLRARQGMSGAEIAKKHGVGRQALSKQALKVIRQYDLPVSANMKSEIAQQAYSLTNRKNSKAPCN